MAGNLNAIMIFLVVIKIGGRLSQLYPSPADYLSNPNQSHSLRILHLNNRKVL